MARREADREDLWREAVALTSRAELSVGGEPLPIVIGFRENGWCSVYWGQDVMLQFTADGRLRRAFREGLLYRTQGGTLARLMRHRTETMTALLRSDLSPAELAAFRAWVHAAIGRLIEAISSGGAAVRRETNAGAEPLLPRIEAALRGVLEADPFLAPAIAGKP